MRPRTAGRLWAFDLSVPSGHKLHVKAHLAGQRGICPECGARFVVPSFSGGRVAGPPPAIPLGPGGDVSASLESTVSFNAGLSQSLPPATAGEAAAWYVRPAAGGQFGPVDTDSFRQWIDQGRVPDDALVWRTGWPEWKHGGEAVRELASRGGGGQSDAAPAADDRGARRSAFDVGAADLRSPMARRPCRSRSTPSTPPAAAGGRSTRA